MSSDITGTELSSEKADLQLEPKKKKKINIKWSKAGNFFVGFFLIYFFFFGFICNSGNSLEQQDPENKLLFVYTAFLSTDKLNLLGIYLPVWLEWLNLIPTWTTIFILFGIGVYQAYREDFLVYSIKNNLLMIPLIILLSWIWYSIDYRVSIFYVIWWYFTSLHGYLNILVLLFIYGTAGILGGYLRIYKYQKDHQI